jgi:hypothetical protein
VDPARRGGLGRIDPHSVAPGVPGVRFRGDRVLRRLTDLERQYRSAGAPTRIPLTQDELASLAGASRATVNRVLRAVAADGLLELRRGRIVVLDVAGLARRGSAGFSVPSAREQYPPYDTG